MITVALIEDHQVLVDALRMLMQHEADLEFAGAADTLRAGRDLLRRVRPSVLLLDVGLPDGSGLDLLPDVKQISPHTQVVVLTSFSDEDTLLKAVDRGVNGFLPKNTSLIELLSTIRRAADGEMVMPTSLLMGLLAKMQSSRFHDDNGENWESLTPREREVLELLAGGASGEEISESLHIAPLTVRTHIRNLMSKLGVHSRLEAVSFALRNGLIEAPN
jgi:DNA-binding NarL/FixJ family response regulator